MSRVLVSRRFQRKFRKLSGQERSRIREGLSALEEDPLTPRPGADIKPLSGTTPPKHRLRVGDFRVIYVVDTERDEVRVIDVFRRGRGYRD